MRTRRARLPIPVRAAQEIAELYGYDQVIIVARKVGEDGGEHCTTYGRDKAHCDVAARCGDFLKHKVMGWHQEQAKRLDYSTLSAVWDKINSHIKHGQLQGNGCDETAERNGLILASNAVSEMMARVSKDQVARPPDPAARP